MHQKNDYEFYQFPFLAFSSILNLNDDIVCKRDIIMAVIEIAKALNVDDDVSYDKVGFHQIFKSISVC